MRHICAALAVLTLSCLPANAAELTKPEPVDHAMPDRKGQCVASQEMKVHLAEVLSTSGGAAAIITPPRAQAFADSWRKQVTTDSVPVSLVLAWIYTNIVVAEFDGRDCLLTFTVMGYADFESILRGMPSVKPDPATDNDLLPNGGRKI